MSYSLQHIPSVDYDCKKWIIYSHIHYYLFIFNSKSDNKQYSTRYDVKLIWVVIICGDAPKSMTWVSCSNWWYLLMLRLICVDLEFKFDCLFFNILKYYNSCDMAEKHHNISHYDQIYHERIHKLMALLDFSTFFL